MKIFSKNNGLSSVLPAHFRWAGFLGRHYPQHPSLYLQPPQAQHKQDTDSNPKGIMNHSIDLKQTAAPGATSYASVAKAYHFRSRIETTVQKPGNLVNHKNFMLTSFPFSRPLLSDRGLFSGDKLRLFITT
ncbi:MAG: hypothetical protein IJV30_00530 [Oscillospiraceae bacterium]|nr:hypothetical protein [Oscillospiraceae bacterium]